MEVNTYILWTEVYNGWISAHTIGAMRFSPWLPTIWRIIPGLVGGSWPALNLYAMNGHLEREQPYLGDLLIMVINHLLTGMILQVPPLCTETTISHFGIPYKFTGITALSSYLSRFVWFMYVWTKRILEIWQMQEIFAAAWLIVHRLTVVRLMKARWFWVVLWVWVFWGVPWLFNCST